jgi:hypothetical protein
MPSAPSPEGPWLHAWPSLTKFRAVFASRRSPVRSRHAPPRNQAGLTHERGLLRGLDSPRSELGQIRALKKTPLYLNRKGSGGTMHRHHLTAPLYFKNPPKAIVSLALTSSALLRLFKLVRVNVQRHRRTSVPKLPRYTDYSFFPLRYGCAALGVVPTDRRGSACEGSSCLHRSRSR